MGVADQIYLRILPDQISRSAVNCRAGDDLHMETAKQLRGYAFEHIQKSRNLTHYNVSHYHSTTTNVFML
jgi:hypothetical protein